MFWKFELQPQSAIDTILTKEDCTLTEILEEDDVLQECKAQNRKLIDFLIRPENLDELVNMVIHEPSEDLDERTRYKLPNTACEVLTSDVSVIIDRVTSNEALLNKIWSFLENESPVNPLLASFFSKVMGILITRKTPLMIEYIKSKEDFVKLLVLHMGTSAIMDLILRLITSVESPQLRQDLLKWLNEQNLIESLVALIDADVDEDKISNSAQALCDIIRLGRDHMSQFQENADPDPLLTTLEDSDTIGLLLDHMLNNAHSNSSNCSLVNGIAVLLALLEVKKASSPIEIEEPMTKLDAERLALGVSSTLNALSPRLKDFHQLLLEPPPTEPMLTTFGTLDPPLGNARLCIANLIAAILATNSQNINLELSKLGTVKVLLDLMFKYSWNNFLHSYVVKCINTVVTNPQAEEDDSKDNPVLDSVLKDCKLHEKLLEAFEDSESQSQSSGRRLGFMGHLTQIANVLVKNTEKGSNSERLQKFINDLPNEDKEQWDTFVSGTLVDINKRNVTDLAGHHPLQSSSDDDDDFRPAHVPFLHAGNSLQQAFSHYQMQNMTADFIDSFGFEDDEFQEPNGAISAPFDRISEINFALNATEDNPNSALFEACCNERISQFDDSGSDEDDVWEEKELTFSSVAESRHSTLSGNDGSDSDSSSSEEDETSHRDKIGGISDEDDEQVVFHDHRTESSDQSAKEDLGGEKKENTMDVDTSEAWTAVFDDSHVAMDTSVDAVAVGWETNTSDSNGQTGWATFDSISDISHTNGSSDDSSCKEGNSPVAMDTESSPLSPKPGSLYVVDMEDVDCNQDTSSLVEKDKNDFMNTAIFTSLVNDMAEPKINSSPTTEGRAALYSNITQPGSPRSSTVPLATDDSDDDISDDENEDSGNSSSSSNARAESDNGDAMQQVLCASVAGCSTTEGTVESTALNSPSCVATSPTSSCSSKQNVQITEQSSSDPSKCSQDATSSSLPSDEGGSNLAMNGPG